MSFKRIILLIKEKSQICVCYFVRKYLSSNHWKIYFSKQLFLSNFKTNASIPGNTVSNNSSCRS